MAENGVVRIEVTTSTGGMSVWGPIYRGDVAEAIDRAKEQILRAGTAPSESEDT